VTNKKRPEALGMDQGKKRRYYFFKH